MDVQPQSSIATCLAGGLLHAATLQCCNLCKTTYWGTSTPLSSMACVLVDGGTGRQLRVLSQFNVPAA
jgi:hypothetical protein